MTKKLKAKAKDDNDRLREGTLPPDPEADAEPMAPPALELADAPTLADAYGLAHLEADRGRQLLSLAKLPPWPDTVPPASGHGWGEHLDQLLGHGLRPGEMVAIGAASAGAGKTAWLMQLVDGVALRNPYLLAGEGAWGPQLTPVLMASEMSPDALAWRSLARWTGHPASTFRAGQSLARRHPSRAPELRQAWEGARQALTGEFGQARHWQRLLSPGKAGLAASRGAKLFVEHLRATVGAWRELLAHEHPGHELVPFVVVDPLQRYQSGHDEVTDLNALARELCAVTAEEGVDHAADQRHQQDGRHGQRERRPRLQRGGRGGLPRQLQPDARGHHRALPAPAAAARGQRGRGARGGALPRSGGGQEPLGQQLAPGPSLPVAQSLDALLPPAARADDP